jgi:hypothetical protein
MSNRLRRLVRWTVPFGVVALFGAVGPEARAGAAYDGSLPLKMTALAVNRTGAVGGTTTGTVDITIERWATEKEAATFRDTVMESGSDALLKWLEGIKPRAGSIRIDDSLGWDIQYAQYQKRPSGGISIVIVTDRPMSYWELTTRPRSAEYEFIFCEIRLDDKGEGQGKLAGAAQIRYSRLTDQIEMENYGIEPIRLQAVKVLESGKGD